MDERLNVLSCPKTRHKFQLFPAQWLVVGIMNSQELQKGKNDGGIEFARLGPDICEVSTKMVCDLSLIGYFLVVNINIVGKLLFLFCY